MPESTSPACGIRPRQGKLAFALVIPPHFSSNAVPGARTGGGKLMVYTSEGNNYQGAHLARRFASDLGNAVNASLNERRWALVLSSSAGSKDSLERAMAQPKRQPARGPSTAVLFGSMTVWGNWLTAFASWARASKPWMQPAPPRPT